VQARLYGIGSNQLPPHVGENLADMLAQVSASAAGKLGHLVSAQFAFLWIHGLASCGSLLTLNYSTILDFTIICSLELDPAMFLRIGFHDFLF
jgi:hypothetical protein